MGIMHLQVVSGAVCKNTGISRVSPQEKLRRVSSVGSQFRCGSLGLFPAAPLFLPRSAGYGKRIKRLATVADRPTGLGNLKLRQLLISHPRNS